jgi:hypothetical protein
MLEYLQTNPFLIFFIMLFCHIVDDYYLQGILASMKQKAWWKKQEGYSEKYADDWFIALFMHAFSWAFMINLIFIILKINAHFIILSIIINCVIHMIVDHLKANVNLINLVGDQYIHICQIWITFIIAMSVWGVI